MENIAEYNVDRLLDELDVIDERIETEGETEELVKLREVKMKEMRKWSSKTIEINRAERKKLPIEEQLAIQKGADAFIKSLMNLDVEKLEEDIKKGKTEFN